MRSYTRLCALGERADEVNEIFTPNNICKYNSGKCASLMDMSRERELCRIRCACNRRTAFNLKPLAYGWVGGREKKDKKLKQHERSLVNVTRKKVDYEWMS